MAHELKTRASGSSRAVGVGNLMEHSTAETPGDDRDAPDRNPDHDPNQDDEAPTTPTDEPQPVPVQDPPAEPDQSPYVVRDARAGQSSREQHHE